MPSREKPIIVFDNTQFIYRTNFAGDPTRDTYGSSERKGNIIIPTKEMADQLAAEGFNVKVTKPRNAEEAEGFIPTYHIVVKLNYDYYDPPVVYMVYNEKKRVVLPAEMSGDIDRARIDRVRVACTPNVNEMRGTKALYIQTMYVYVSSSRDPFAAEFADEDEEFPFA